MSSTNHTLTLRRIVMLIVAIIAIILLFVLFRTSRTASRNQTLQTALVAHSVTPIDLGDMPDPELVELGRLLFFDKELSGNRDISCATCHHPSLAGADGRVLPIGTGGAGLGSQRLLRKSRILVPRNAPELFNRGSAEWETMFWDGRVASEIYGEGETQFDNPAETLLPTGLDSVLAAQAMFPPTSAVEMRGAANSVDVNGNPNEIAANGITTMPKVWANLTSRLMQIDEYRALFAAAYPDVSAEEIGFEHAANALAAFEIAAFSFNDSPWEQFLAGDDEALSAEQKQGAQLFYGKAQCASCHTGSLMTDQQYHNIGVPQLGPGKEAIEGYDFGRFLETNIESDRFAFRTPPLASIALTAPYMHNGAYRTLEDAVKHHLNAPVALANYNILQLDPTLRDTVKTDKDEVDYVLATLDEKMQTPIELSEAEVAQLLAFLNALTSPEAMNLAHLVPESVPSGLPVTD